MPWARSPIDSLRVDIKSFETFYSTFVNSLENTLLKAICQCSVEFVERFGIHTRSLNEARSTRGFSCTTPQGDYFSQPQYGSQVHGSYQRVRGPNNLGDLPSHGNPSPHSNQRFERRPDFSHGNSHPRNQTFCRAQGAFQPMPGAPCFKCGKKSHSLQFTAAILSALVLQ